MTSPILLAVPNVSEGRNAETIARIGDAFAGGGSAGGGRRGREPAAGVRLLDVHSDSDHHRSVYTLAGPQGMLADALLGGAAAAVDAIDVVARASRDAAEAGQHPHVGAVDVVPIVYLDLHARGAACAEALVVADRIGSELSLPVLLYGDLAGDGVASTRAHLRRGGVARLAERLALAPGAADALRPDFGPAQLHPTAGAALVAAREPLVAFNLQLQGPATIEDARRIAALIREGGHQGLPGLRAIGVQLGGGVAQVSMNVERPLQLALAQVIEAVGRHAPVASAELVGLAPSVALQGFPEDLPMPGFDPARQLIENALGS